MIPFVKIAAIFIKTFTKPMIGYAKKSGVQSGRVRQGFIWLGNKLYRIETNINRRFLGMEAVENESRRLSDDAAFENAFNFILEVVVLYGILLGIAFSEVKKGIEEKKQAKLVIENLQEGVANLEKQLEEQRVQSRSLEKTISAYQNNERLISEVFEAIKLSNEQQEKKSLERDQKLLTILAQHTDEITDLRRSIDLSSNKIKQDQL